MNSLAQNDFIKQTNSQSMKYLPDDFIHSILTNSWIL